MSTELHSLEQSGRAEGKQREIRKKEGIYSFTSRIPTARAGLCITLAVMISFPLVQVFLFSNNFFWLELLALSSLPFPLSFAVIGSQLTNKMNVMNM